MTTAGMSSSLRTVDTFACTLESLQRGLSVDLIASRPLIACCCTDLVDEVLARVECHGIDYVPVRKDGSIVGVFSRIDGLVGDTAAEEYMVAINDHMLIEASAGILSYVHLAVRSPYHLVVKQGAIDGIVTRSDLMKLPVRLVLFAFLTHLEATMTRAVRTVCPDDTWLGYMDAERQGKVEREFHEGCQANVYAEKLCYTQWCDKRDILAAALPEAIRGSKGRFSKDLKDLEALRNNIMHSNEFLPDAKKLSELVHTAGTRILQLEDLLQGGRDG